MSDQSDYLYFSFDNRNYRLNMGDPAAETLWSLLDSISLVRLLDSWEIEAAGVISKPVRIAVLNYNPQHKA